MKEVLILYTEDRPKRREGKKKKKERKREDGERRERKKENIFIDLKTLDKTCEQPQAFRTH